MEQLVFQLPVSSRQIFALPYPVPPGAATPQVESMQDKDLNLRQGQILEALHLFKQASADLLL
jgi:hypothetical protein